MRALLCGGADAGANNIRIRQAGSQQGITRSKVPADSCSAEAANLYASFKQDRGCVIVRYGCDAEWPNTPPGFAWFSASLRTAVLESV